MDIVSDVLRAVRMTGAFFFDVTTHATWVAGEPSADALHHRVMPEHQHVIPFHMILGGSCWLESDDEEPYSYQLGAGDIVVYPHGRPHYFMSRPGMRERLNPEIFDPIPNRKQVLRYVVKGDDDQPANCHFACGYMGCDIRPFNPLLDALPPMMLARGSDESRDWLVNLALVGISESERDGIGAGVKLAKLADLMFVEVIRQFIDDPTKPSSGWISGLRDPHLGAALQLIHARPAEDWTLEKLATEVGLSRSVFAERFARLVGMPAMQYLARWRLTLAARLLEDGSISVAQAAMQVGYESDAAFQKAFKKHVGVTPAAWRKRSMPAVSASVAQPALA